MISILIGYLEKTYGSRTVRRMKHFSVIIFFFLCLGTLMSQTPSFRHYSVNDGLPSSEIYHVFQDKKGYVWVSTDCGVSKFDGYSFKTYSTSQGLPDNCVFQVIEDHKERKWLRSFSGRLSYIEQGEVHVLDCYESVKKWLKRGVIRNIHVDLGDTLWLSGTSTNGILKIAPPYRNEDALIEKVSCEDFFIKEHGNTFLSGYEMTTQPINRWARITVLGKNGKKVVVPLSYFKFGQGRNAYCSQIDNGKYFIGWDKQVAMINLSGEYIVRDMDKQVICTNVSSDKRLWVSQYHGGVDIFSVDSLAKGRPIQHYLDGKSVSWILEDNEKGLWFATLDDGLYYFRSEDFKHYDFQQQFQIDKVNCLVKTENTVYAGLANGKLAAIGKKAITEIPLSIGKPPGSIQSLFLSDSSTLMVGTPGGFYVVDLPSRKPLRFWCMLSRSMARSLDGGVWLGSSNEVFKVYPRREHPIAEQVNLMERITSVYEDNSGKLWIGTISSLFLYENKKLLKFNEIGDVKVADINSSKDGTIYIATIGRGVFQIKDKVVTSITQRDGMSSDLCRSLYLEDDKTIWVGTNAGVSKIVLSDQKLQKYSIVKYTRETGLCSNDVYQVTGEKNKTIWLATNNGIDRFIASTDPDVLTPPLHLSSVKASGVELPLQLHYDLNPESNTIEIGFTGITFRGQENVIYKYKMVGVDKSWSYTTHRTVRYPQLDPGTYKLQVFAVNPSYKTLSGPLSVDITIHPQFYKTWWFNTTLLLGLPSLLGFSIVRGVRRSRIRERQQRELKQKIAETELKALKAQMKPHFIFNTLNAIQYFIIKNDTESAERYLNTFARLLRNVLENSDLTVIPLLSEVNTMKHYLELEKLRYKERLQYSIEVDPNIPSNVMIPPMLVQPYLENAIVHGIAPVEKGGKVTLNFKEQKGYIVVTIEDNGVGLNNSARNKVGSHKSMGMKITKDRLEILNIFYKDKNVEVVMTDLSNEHNDLTGTRIELYIPSVS